MRREIIVTIAVLLAAGCNEPPGQRELVRGQREIQRGNFNQACTQLEKSIAARPGSEQNLEAYNYLGIACWKLGRTQEAMEAFESARRLSPIAPEPTYNLGVLCAEAGETPRALQLLKDAALMDEKDPRPLEYMGAIYAGKQQWPEARRSYFAARSRAPASPRILTAIALVELETEKPETAAATLQGALRHDPKYAPALFNLAVISHTKLNAPAQARTYFEKFLTVTSSGPQAGYARRWLAAFPAAASQPDATQTHRDTTTITARAEADEIPPVRIPPPSLPAQPSTFAGGTDLLAKAREAADRGRNDEALDFCLQAAQQSAARGDKAAQEKSLRLGVQICVDSARAHTELGNFLLTQGQNDAALRSFKAALTLNESFAPAFLGLGKAAAATREFDTALVGFKQAVQADPSNPDALWLLAQLYDKSVEMPASATKAYSDFLKLFPADPRAALARERIRVLATARHAATPAPTATARNENTAAAAVAAAAQRAASVPATQPERPPPQTLPSRLTPYEVNPDVAAASRPAAGAQNPAAGRQAFARATDYQQRGDWNNALVYYEQAVRNDPSLDSAWFNLGAGYSLRGDTARAKDAYLRALQIKPGYTEARYNLAVLYIESKDYAAAEKMLADLSQRNPGYANTWLALGQIYARNPATIPQAKAAYKKFLELAPTSRSAPGVKQWLQSQ